MHTALTETITLTHKGGMTTMDTQINYSDDMMRLRRDAILSLKEFGFGRNIYEFCTDWVLNHDTTAGIREAFREYETQRSDKTFKVST
tara:strand:+ start:92 stop:355 length:264 start_codon:yes stop_codon:yes gene_type:complete